MKDHVSRKQTIERAREVHLTLRMVRDRILARREAIITLLTKGDKWPTLTPKQVHMLITIREEGETSVKNLASRLFETPPSASSMVKRLHARGMVSREFDEGDRRKVVVALSPKGEQFVAKVEELFVESFADVLEEIGSEYAEKLTDVCAGIRVFLDRKAWQETQRLGPQSQEEIYDILRQKAGLKKYERLADLNSAPAKGQQGMIDQRGNGYATKPQPEPGWMPLKMPAVLTERRSFLSDGAQNNRVRIAYYCRETDKRVFAKVWFGPGAEGPPGHAHGGSIAAVLDEAMGLAVWVDGHPALSAKLNVQFRKKIPIGTDTIVEAWVQQVNGKRVATRSHVTDAKSGICFAEAEALLITLPPERQSLYPGFDA